MAARLNSVNEMPPAQVMSKLGDFWHFSVQLEHSESGTSSSDETVTLVNYLTILAFD
jgi:hypothetical protein